MFNLQIGAHQKNQNILKLLLFCVIINNCDELAYPVFRKKSINEQKHKRQRFFRREGWKYTARYTGKNVEHRKKHLLTLQKSGNCLVTQALKLPWIVMFT